MKDFFQFRESVNEAKNFPKDDPHHDYMIYDKHRAWTNVLKKNKSNLKVLELIGVKDQNALTRGAKKVEDFYSAAKKRKTYDAAFMNMNVGGSGDVSDSGLYVKQFPTGAFLFLKTGNSRSTKEKWTDIFIEKIKVNSRNVEDLKNFVFSVRQGMGYRYE